MEPKEKKNVLVYNKIWELKDFAFVPGMLYQNKNEVKQAIQKYAICYGVNIKWSKSTLVRCEYLVSSVQNRNEKNKKRKFSIIENRIDFGQKSI